MGEGVKGLAIKEKRFFLLFEDKKKALIAWPLVEEIVCGFPKQGCGAVL